MYPYPSLLQSVSLVIACFCCCILGALPRQRASVDGTLGSSRSSGPTLVSAVAGAVGARPAVSQELLGHFVRAGGGDVGKTASLYLAVADEFVELREMARWV